MVRRPDRMQDVPFRTTRCLLANLQAGMHRSVWSVVVEPFLVTASIERLSFVQVKRRAEARWRRVDGVATRLIYRATEAAVDRGHDSLPVLERRIASLRKSALVVNDTENRGERHQHCRYCDVRAQPRSLPSRAGCSAPEDPIRRRSRPLRVRSPTGGRLPTGRRRRPGRRRHPSPSPTHQVSMKPRCCAIPTSGCAAWSVERYAAIRSSRAEARRVGPPGGSLASRWSRMLASGRVHVEVRAVLLSGEEFDRASRPGRGGQLSVTGEQSTVEVFGQRNVGGVVCGDFGA